MDLQLQGEISSAHMQLQQGLTDNQLRCRYQTQKHLLDINLYSIIFLQLFRH